jgi:hypothetical protein
MRGRVIEVYPELKEMIRELIFDDNVSRTKLFEAFEMLHDGATIQEVIEDIWDDNQGYMYEEYSEDDSDEAYDMMKDDR